MFTAAVTIFPSDAHAGVFSFLFEGSKASAQESSQVNKEANAQNVGLLQSVSSPDPLARGGGDTTIVDSSALLPESGPLGTLADIADGEPTSDQISIYTVRKGDNISGIAKMFGVSSNTIVWANDLKGAIAPGQNLVILPVSGVRYTVKTGDTLEKVADKFKANAEEIADFNGLTAVSKLAIGDSIIIPDGEIVPPPVKKPVTPTKTPVKTTVYAVGGPLIPGYYARPLVGGRKTQALHGYNGVDIATPIGSTITAAAEGKVIISKMGGYNAGYGNYIVIAHPNGTQTLYGHLSQTVAQVGAQVERGQTIGLSGNTGKSTGPHLHFEVRGAANPF